MVSTLESDVSVARTSMNPSSSPSASEGSVAMNGMFNGTAGVSSTFSNVVPACGSTDQSSGRFDASYVMFQLAVREPVAVTVTSTTSVVPGSILGTVSGLCMDTA